MIAIANERGDIDFMRYYHLLKAQEQLYYISFVAELGNIFYFLSIVLGINSSFGLGAGMLLFNAIYGLYMFSILFFIRGRFRRVAYIILPMAILRGFIWDSSPILSILISILSIGVLVYYHQFIYIILDKIEEAIEEGEV